MTYYDLLFTKKVRKTALESHQVRETKIIRINTYNPRSKAKKSQSN